MILSHRYPEHVSRLVNKILEVTPQSRILVFHDERDCAAPELTDQRVHVAINTEAADWGSWELVLASLTALRTAADLFDPDVFVLMSGQDYPARNLAEWENEFFERGGGWIGDVWELKYQPHWGKPWGVGDDDLTRYVYRWYPLPFGRSLASSDAALSRAARWVLYKAGHYLEPVFDVRTVTRGRGMHVGLRAIRTPFTEQSPCMRGSQWLAFDRALFGVICRTHDRNNLLRNTYRRSIIPDESYFQTILSAVSPPQSGHALTFVEWVVEDDQPRTLTMSDLADIRASAAPLCRKVAPGMSDALLDALDELTHAPT